MRRLRSWTLQEPQIERREHQDNSDVYYQPLPELVPEEQDVHADHDGYQREHVKHDGCLSSHRSFLLCATEWSKSGAGFSETLALAGPFDALFSRGAPRLRVTTTVKQQGPGSGTVILTWAFTLERVTGIEPALSAWEADVLPLNYTRVHLHWLAAEAACAVFAQTSYRNR